MHNQNIAMLAEQKRISLYDKVFEVASYLQKLSMGLDKLDELELDDFLIMRLKYEYISKIKFDKDFASSIYEVMENYLNLESQKIGVAEFENYVDKDINVTPIQERIILMSVTLLKQYSLE